MSSGKAFLDVAVDDISAGSIVLFPTDVNIVDLGYRGIGIDVDDFSASHVDLGSDFNVTYVEMKSPVTVTLPLEWETIEW